MTTQKLESFFPINEQLFRFSHPSKAIMVYEKNGFDLVGRKEYRIRLHQFNEYLEKIRVDFRQRRESFIFHMTMLS